MSGGPVKSMEKKTFLTTATSKTEVAVYEQA